MLNFIVGIVESTTESNDVFTFSSLLLVIFTALLVILVVHTVSTNKQSKNAPPRMTHYLPVGHIVGFGMHPVKFIQDGRKKFGDMFTARILNKDMTFLTHPDVYDLFFKGTDDELGLREVYKFMTPVFGKGVVYDADSQMMMEQVKFVSSGLTTQRFHHFVDVFEEEVDNKIKQLGETGTFGCTDTMADLIIFTASRSLLGNGIREFLETKGLGTLYHDLDAGISALSFFYPGIPQGQRDRASTAIRSIFSELIEKRKLNPDDDQDVLNELLNAKYRESGEPVPKEHIIGVLIAGLFAGQHTSTIAISWTLMSIISNKHIYEKVMEEQKRIMCEDNAKLSYDKVMEMEYLERCMREALRMYPPLIMLMRYVKKARKWGDYIVPKGNVLVVSPSVTGRCEDVYENPDVFDPERFAEPRKEHEKKRHANLAFGSGRHKCIGENFAILQVKSIISKLLRTYDMKLLGKLPTIDYTSLVVGPTTPCVIEYKKRF
ncbi:sterol 14-alpha-demethylase [Acrasis kona]|uniref:Sterol 14-alpha-demethylase n=1 Tax=Acrasis kona TaxID=1008807 RepID=A0AAW2ZIL4_9EUKA